MIPINMRSTRFDPTFQEWIVDQAFMRLGKYRVEIAGRGRDRSEAIGNFLAEKDQVMKESAVPRDPLAEFLYDIAKGVDWIWIKVKLFSQYLG